MNPFRLSTRMRAAPSRRRSPPTECRAGRTGADTVPWSVVRRTGDGLVEIEHRGDGPLHSVRFALAGEGMLGLSLPRTVFPGERVSVLVRGVDAEMAAAAGDAMLVVRWFQPDGTELLWPIAL